MRKSIATVSMSGTLRAKLEAIAAARFDGYELFENDLIHFNGSPAAAGALAADLGLTCELYQPFRDLEGTPDATFRRSLGLSAALRCGSLFRPPSAPGSCSTPSMARRRFRSMRSGVC